LKGSSEKKDSTNSSGGAAKTVSKKADVGNARPSKTGADTAIGQKDEL